MGEQGAKGEATAILIVMLLLIATAIIFWGVGFVSGRMGHDDRVIIERTVRPPITRPQSAEPPKWNE